MIVKPRRILSVIILLAVAGIAVSSVSLYHHYDKSESSFCDFGGKFNCDIVNRSIYSTVFDVPVASIGILGYVALGFLAQAARMGKPTTTFLFVSSLVGLGFALRLTYIEGFILAAWCLLCLSSLAVIFSIATLAGILVMRRQRV